MTIKRKLNDRLTLIKESEFPSSYRVPSLRYEAVIGIGGNIGDVRRRFRHLSMVLRRSVDVRVHQTAPILKNPPFGYLDQEDFYNSVIVVSTRLQPRALLQLLLRLEKRFGRRRSFANAPRTLDLDLLFFDGRIIEHSDLIVPHPHWHERESVVIPLSYLGKRR